MTTALALENLSRHYLRLRAVDSVSMTVKEGDCHAVIGPNGAGKSTLFDLVAGTVRQTSGKVELYGQPISGLSEHRRARLGLVKTFQHSSLFLDLSVVDNVAISVQRRMGTARHLWSTRRAHDAVRDEARSWLEKAGLGSSERARASELSHGERRHLEVVVALACQPRVLMLDEPTAGMSIAESEKLTDLIKALPSEITVLLIEHDLDVVFQLAQRVTVMHLGQVLAEGTPDEVRGSTEVQEAYLGAADQSEIFTKGKT